MRAVNRHDLGDPGLKRRMILQLSVDHGILVRVGSELPMPPRTSMPEPPLYADKRREARRLLPLRPCVA